MADIALGWDDLAMGGVWSLANGDLAAGDDLATAYAISLFTDRAAGVDDLIPDGSDNPRGWWGDADLGSHIWLHERSVANVPLLAVIEQAALDACQWMIDTEAVAAHAFTAEYIAPGFMALSIQSTDRSGRTVAFRYRWAWQALAAA